MSDMIARVPIEGATTYDFGESTPNDWPRLYVDADAYREVVAANRERTLNHAKTQTGWFIKKIAELNKRIRELEGSHAALEDALRWALMYGCRDYGHNRRGYHPDALNGGMIDAPEHYDAVYRSVGLIQKVATANPEANAK
jgi:hypothetical protein